MPNSVGYMHGRIRILFCSSSMLLESVRLPPPQGIYLYNPRLAIFSAASRLPTLLVNRYSNHITLLTAKSSFPETCPMKSGREVDAKHWKGFLPLSMGSLAFAKQRLNRGCCPPPFDKLRVAGHITGARSWSRARASK